MDRIRITQEHICGNGNYPSSKGMTTLLLVDTAVAGYEQIVAAAQPSVTTVLFDRFVDTFQTLKDKIAAATPAEGATTVGIVQHGDQRAPIYKLLEAQVTPALIRNAETNDPSLESWAELKDFYGWLKSRGATTIDLISCALYANPGWVYVLQTLEQQLTLDFRASINNTGNIASGGDWIQESDGVNIQTIYFTEEIDEYIGLLFITYKRRNTQMVFASGTIALNGRRLKGSITKNRIINADSLPENMITEDTTKNTIFAWGPDNAGNPNIGSPITTIAAHDSALAALRADGSVYAWGSTDFGGSNTQAAQANSGSPVIAITTNQYSFAALRSNGSVYAWGGATYGGIGQVALASSGSRVTEIGGSYYAFAALRENGSVYSWGEPSNSSNNLDASLANSGSLVVAIATTQNAFAALRANGSVFAWGNTGGGGSNSQAALANSGSIVVSLSSTNYAFAALRSNRSVYAWGNATWGGSNSQAALANSGSPVSAIASAPFAFTALRSNGTVYAWGLTTEGGDNSQAALANTGSPIIALSSSNGAFAALRQNGTVYAWGSLGTGGLNSEVTLASSGSPVIALTSNNQAFAALRSDGSVYAWGLDTFGGIGFVSLASSGSPVVSIASTGGDFSALRADGTIYNWGSSQFDGALAGNGNFTIASNNVNLIALKPTPVPSDATNAVSNGYVGNFVAMSSSSDTSLSLSLRSAINSASGSTRTTARSDFIKSMSDRLQASSLTIPSTDFTSFKSTVQTGAAAYTYSLPVQQHFPTTNIFGSSGTLEISSFTTNLTNVICVELPINVPITLTENGTSVGTIFYNGTNLYNGFSAGAPQITIGSTITYGTKTLSRVATGSLVGYGGTLPAAPSAPTISANPQVQTTTSIKYNWTANPSLNQYTLTLTGGAIPIIQTVPSSTSTYTFTGLTPETNYSATIIVTDNYNQTSSASTYNTVPLGLLSAPTISPNPQVQTPASIRFSWTADPSLNTYVITLFGGATSTPVTLLSNVSAYTFSGLAPNTNYSATIVANDNFNQTSSASTYNTVPLGLFQPAPSITPYPFVTPNTITCYWTPDPAAIQNYYIQVQFDNQTNGPFTVSNTTSSYTFTGLTNGRNHTVSLWGRDPFNQDSLVALYRTVQPGARPGPPTNVSFTQQGSALTVTWGPPDSDGGSVILGYAIRDTNRDLKFGIDDYSRSFQTSIAAGTYRFTICAVNAARYGALVTSQEFTF